MNYLLVYDWITSSGDPKMEYATYFYLDDVYDFIKENHLEIDYVSIYELKEIISIF